jgi:BirA family biotin operon repressor/biotin-[acetyl-CoA-carboxylase] ligase
MWNIHKFTSLPSTNTYARELLSQGNAKHGDVFQAEHQTAGRGRLNDRVWIDEPSNSLLMSIVLTEVYREFVQFASYVSALCVCQSMRVLLSEVLPKFDPQRLRIKWPNDIWLDGKKLAGVLAEALWGGWVSRGVVIGIGLNVNQREFGSELETKATSLRSVTGVERGIDDVRDRILTALETYVERSQTEPQGQFKAAILAELRTELAWMAGHPPFSITQDDGSLQKGVSFVEIDDDGAIVVRDAAGNLNRYFAGFLHL